MSLTSSSMPARAKRGYFSLARLRRPFRTEAGVETIEATARNPAATTPACPLPDLTRPALWVFGTFILAAVMSGRCLYGDGSYEFVRVLEAGTFVPLLGCRVAFKRGQCAFKRGRVCEQRWTGLALWAWRRPERSGGRRKAHRARRTGWPMRLVWGSFGLMKNTIVNFPIV